MGLRLSSNITEWLHKPNSLVVPVGLGMVILHIHKVLYPREEWARLRIR